jgi:hypothetical protein
MISELSREEAERLPTTVAGNSDESPFLSFYGKSPFFLYYGSGVSN